MIQHIFAVGGTFDENGGKPSGYFRQLIRSLPQENVVNGGSLNDLEAALRRATSSYINIWMPNVSNELEKTLKSIKQLNPKSLLVISKRNLNHEYSPLQLMARALDAKANLLLEINQRSYGGVFLATVWDPLGNRFVDQTGSPRLAFGHLYNRLVKLARFTRIKSTYTLFEGLQNPNEEQEQFLAIAREIAEKFHGLVHAVDQHRFVGNLSFRCEYGFPSMRLGNGFYCSRRNVDKRNIDKDNLVYVLLDPDPRSELCYGGTFDQARPSVDAPIHRYLYSMFPEMNYMLHGHVYVKHVQDGTDEVIPCGSLEEGFAVAELYERWRYLRYNGFTVNLQGHGFLAMAKTPEYFRGLEFVQREIGR
jgi:ribulose-5-phosphate 4-epimerase/fuculose-1-phosphate aldolase